MSLDNEMIGPQLIENPDENRPPRLPPQENEQLNNGNDINNINDLDFAMLINENHEPGRQVREQFPLSAPINEQANRENVQRANSYMNGDGKRALREATPNPNHALQQNPTGRASVIAVPSNCYNQNYPNSGANSTNSRVEISSINNEERPKARKSYKKMNDVAKIIPEFNSTNITINLLIKKCKTAEGFVDPADKDYYIELVESKVVSNAQAYLQCKSFETLDQLLSELKRSFAPIQSLPQIQTELARVRQKSDEKVSIRVTSNQGFAESDRIH